MGKIRDLFKKIRGTKGTFHAKMGTIKDRNGIDLTEAEDTKKKWQEYTEEIYKRAFFSLYNSAAHHPPRIDRLPPALLLHCSQHLWGHPRPS